MINVLREHAKTARCLCKITAGHASRRLVANAELETSWAPIHELDSALGLDARNSGLNVLGHNITTV